MSFSCVKIKRASLERDFYTALFVYKGINLHTVRHKSVLHNITSPNLKATTPLLGSQNKCRHAVQYTLHLYWYSHMFIPYFFCIICNRSLHYMQKVMKNFVQFHQNKHIPTQNAMPQASIRPEADYLKKKKVSHTVYCGIGVWYP